MQCVPAYFVQKIIPSVDQASEGGWRWLFVVPAHDHPATAIRATAQPVPVGENGGLQPNRETVLRSPLH